MMRPTEIGRFLTYSKPWIFWMTPSSKTLKFEAWRWLTGLPLSVTVVYSSTASTVTSETKSGALT